MHQYAAVAHLVERHLAKVEVASSSLVGRSNGVVFITPHMVTWPSGKARVCKTLIHQFKSGRHLQKIPGNFGFRDFLFYRQLPAYGNQLLQPDLRQKPSPLGGKVAVNAVSRRMRGIYGEMLLSCALISHLR